MKGKIIQITVTGSTVFCLTDKGEVFFNKSDACGNYYGWEKSDLGVIL